MREGAEREAPRVQSLEIRSYRSVFDLERRLYQIDRLRLNPAGIPLRGVLYFVVLSLACATLARLPLTGIALHALPWPGRDLALPATAATLLTLIRIEGRPCHRAVASLVRDGARPRCVCVLSGSRLPVGPWRPPEILFLPDGSDARPRRLRFTGPGAVLIAGAHERVIWRTGPLRTLRRGSHITVRELPGVRPPRRAQVVELGPGVRLDLRPAGPRGPSGA